MPTTLSPPTHDDSSRLDFFEGARSFTYRALVAPLLTEYPARVAERVAAGGTEPVTKEEAGELYTADPRYLFACGIQRTAQRMTWRTAAESVHRGSAGEAPTAELAAVGDGLELDPDLELPAWYTQHDSAGRDDIHLVPGGYWRDDLIGSIYDRGGAAYRLAWRGGYDARPGALHAFVRAAAGAEDPARVLDLGCSFGGLTRVVRAVLPEAEVTGIDISAPALRHAHHLARRSGQAITYAQRDAEATGYPDGSFDLVCAFLLLHEVPDDVRARIVAESLRVLRPGGRVAFLDIPPYSALDPARAWFESFDGRGNGENFWECFLASDFPALLRDTGFTDVADGPLDFEEPGYWGSSALWREGRFDPVHRWVTTARKPEVAP